MVGTLVPPIATQAEEGQRKGILDISRVNAEVDTHSKTATIRPEERSEGLFCCVLCCRGVECNCILQI